MPRFRQRRTKAVSGTSRHITTSRWRAVCGPRAASIFDELPQRIGTRHGVRLDAQRRTLERGATEQRRLHPRHPSVALLREDEPYRIVVTIVVDLHPGDVGEPGTHLLDARRQRGVVGREEQRLAVRVGEVRKGRSGREWTGDERPDVEAPAAECL